MKPYKSIFKESGGSLQVNSNFEKEATKIVDISNLVWSDDTKKVQLTWHEAISSCPPGWRLPTIQELYTARSNRVASLRPYFHWSSTEVSNWPRYAWGISPLAGHVKYDSKDLDYYVRYVKEI